MKYYRSLNDICEDICEAEIKMGRKYDPPYGKYLHPIFKAKGNLRGCFDPLSSEWNELSMHGKLTTIGLFLMYISFEELVQAYKEFEKREYVLFELLHAICILSEFLPEAAEYVRTYYGTEYDRSLQSNIVLSKANEIADKILGSS